MTLMTQIELELESYGYGRQREADRIAQRERAHQGNENSYSQPLYRSYVLPLAEAISAEQTKARGRGRKPAVLRLLAPLHAENTAMVVVRAAVNHLVGPSGFDARILFAELGEAAYHEHLLEHFSEIEPDLFHNIAKGFSKRMSKDEQYRLNVVRNAARDAGKVLPEWDANDIERLGMWMADALHTLGMLNVDTEHTGPKVSELRSSFSEGAAAVIDQVKHSVIENSPYFSPCVEPPKDWTSFDCGGFHTPEMRRLLPYAVKAMALGRESLAAADISQSLSALNAMQRSAWRINTRVRDTLRNLGGKVDLGEVLAQSDDPRPEKPAWLVQNMDTTDMTEEQLKEFRVWKRATSKWHTKRRERTIKWGRYKQAMAAADKFAAYPAIYFVYFCDYRDRKYAVTNGVSPQGSDLQKALLEASTGQLLNTPGALDWFYITGANRFGYDKEALHDRIAWCGDNLDDILLCAADPVANLWWLKADKPLQFLAWCFEVLDLHTFGLGVFRSHITVGMDGSCNGLQNFSAMLRDEVGGRATNLIQAEKPQDIYGNVSTCTWDRLVADVVPPTDERKLEKWESQRLLRDLWMEHGMNRKITKRSVMTLPYGSTRFSCTDFICGDYLEEGLAPEFQEEQYFPAASYLSGLVWPAIGDVVVKAREAMEWLQASATEIIGSGQNRVGWVTPVGFPVVQVYWQENVFQVNTKLCGRQKVLLRSPTSEPNKLKHKNGVAPNFIHSMDAAHLTRVANRLAAEGVEFMHMVHDDFGVRPADAERLYWIIREEFVAMYEGCDPLADFLAAYPDHCPTLPDRGTLDLSCVMDSPFFFS